MRFSKVNLVVSAALSCSLLVTTGAYAQDEPAGDAPAGDAPAEEAPAAAEPAAPAGGEAAAPAAAAGGDAPGVREHDGFFFRFGLGLGYFMGKSKPEEGSGELDVTGLGIPLDLSFGGTIAPGLVIGGGSFGMYVPSPKLKNGTETDGGAVTMGALGPFVDYYLNPKEGLHLQAALLLVNAMVAEKDNQPKGSGIGFGFHVGGGYDLWIGEQWSLNLMARVSYYNVKVKYDITGDPKATLSGFAPGLLVGLTYH